MPLCPCALVSRAQDSQSLLGGAQQVNSYSTSRLLCPCQREAINLLLKDGSDTKGINMTWPLSTPAHRPSLLPHFQGPHSNSYLLWGLSVLITASMVVEILMLAVPGVTSQACMITQSIACVSLVWSLCVVASAAVVLPAGHGGEHTRDPQREDGCAKCWACFQVWATAELGKDRENKEGLKGDRQSPWLRVLLGLRGESES